MAQIQIPPILAKACWSVLIAISVYAAALLSLSIPFLQRQALYVHNLNPSLWQNINKPEQFGFAKNQITPFTFTTPDNETIHAWHILPLGLYAKHENELLQRPSGCAEDITRTKAFKLLRDDPESRLVIVFHGNAGTVAQGWRTDSYRSLSGGSSSKIHILAIDYRGFGLSTGSPTERGVIIDGVATIEWAMNVAKIPSERIAIFGQSLGTGVTCAVAEYFAEQGIDLAGIVLVAGFTSIPNLLPRYKIGGYLPVMAPFRLSKWFKKGLERYVVDTWRSNIRLANVVQLGKRVRIFIISSKNDGDIPWTEAEGLFAAAAKATTAVEMDTALFEEMKAASTIDMGGGAFTSTWNAGGDKIIREDIVLYGHHSRIMTYATVSLAILKAFELDD